MRAGQVLIEVRPDPTPLEWVEARRLDACEAAHGGAPPEVEEIIEAFIAPTLQRPRNRKSRHFTKLIGRSYANPKE